MSKILVITAGHSNVDPGAVNGKDTEAQLVTGFRNAVAFYLRNYGYTVKTDGVGDVNQPLADAIKLIKGSAVAIEFHMNAAASKSAKGVETISLPKDKALAKKLSAGVAKLMGSPLRGEDGWIDQSKSARGKLGYINAGGLIVELEFISNDAKLKLFKDTYWKVAKQVAQDIHEYLGD